jgi:group I intron endonuclease
MNFIYITTNLLNGKKYIGAHSTDNINDGYIGSGRYFLRSVKKYGKENFKREIIQECDPSLNLTLEQKYIKYYNTLSPNGYNLSPTGGLGLKGKQSEETKRKISKSNSIALAGVKRSKESIRKQIESRKGFKQTEETKKKIGDSHKKNKALVGFKHTEETKKRMSNSKKKSIPWNKGIKTGERDLETRKKISKSSIGKKMSEEARLKMSLSKSFLTEKEKLKIMNLIKQETPIKKIANIFGVNISSIYKIKYKMDKS